MSESEPFCLLEEARRSSVCQPGSRTVRLGEIRFVAPVRRELAASAGVPGGLSSAELPDEVVDELLAGARRAEEIAGRAGCWGS